MPHLLEGSIMCTWCLVFATDVQGMPLDHLVLMAWRAFCSWVHRTVAITGKAIFIAFLAGYHVQGTAQTVDWAIFFPPICEGGHFACPRALDWEVVFGTGTYFSGQWSCSQGRYAVDTIFSFSLCLALACWYLPERSLSTPLEPNFFAIAMQGTLPDSLALVVSSAYACGPSGLYIFAYF